MEMEIKPKSNAGRKRIPENEKVKVVNLFIKESEIQKNGGIESIQDKCYKMLKINKKK